MCVLMPRSTMSRRTKLAVSSAFAVVAMMAAAVASAPITAHHAIGSHPLDVELPDGLAWGHARAPGESWRHPATVSRENRAAIPPGMEREALMAIFNATSGPTWAANAGWGTGLPACGWFGITCDGGHITMMYVWVCCAIGCLAWQRGASE